MTKEIETQYSWSCITCPYCGWKDIDHDVMIATDIHNGMEEEIECPDCPEKFMAQINFEFESRPL